MKFNFYFTMIVFLFTSAVYAGKINYEDQKAGSNQVLLEVAFAHMQATDNHQMNKNNFSVMVNNDETATVKIDSFQIDMKPRIFKNQNEEPQILTELVVYDQNQNVLSRPTLMIINQKNAALVINNEETEDIISIEITPTIGE